MEKRDRGCPYCEIDRRAGYPVAPAGQCVHRTVPFTGRDGDGHWAIIDPSDGRPQLRKGPFETQNEAFKTALLQAAQMTELAWELGWSDLDRGMYKPRQKN